FQAQPSPFQAQAPQFQAQPSPFQAQAPQFHAPPPFQAQAPQFQAQPPFQAQAPQFQAQPPFQAQAPQFQAQPPFGQQAPVSPFGGQPQFQGQQPFLQPAPRGGKGSRGGRGGRGRGAPAPKILDLTNYQALGQGPAQLQPQASPFAANPGFYSQGVTSLVGPRGRMNYTDNPTVLNSTTYSGLTADIALSALAKYIRRGTVNKALECATDLFRFNETVNGDNVVKVLCDRLMTVAAKDIGPANPRLSSIVLSRVKSYKY